MALKVFDEKTAVALVHYGNQNQVDANGAHQFICLILKLWHVLNVKSVDKGIRKRDGDSESIRAINDPSVIFLQDVYYWLVQWESMNQKPREGCLTSETMFALKYTVLTFLVLIPYLLNEMKLSYVLTGKFQTDSLESRFGSYRRLSGTNYHISVMEVMESEKKLKILSILNVVSELNVTIKDFIASCSNSGNDAAASIDVVNNAGLYDVITECDIGVAVSEAECKSLIFIAGFVGYKLLTNTVICELCCNELITEHVMEVSIDDGDEQYSYLRDLDRGGLKWPTDLLVEIVAQVFFVFNCLVSLKYESKFLALLSSQKPVVMRLSIERFNLIGLLYGIDCVCGATANNVCESATAIVANILLNNYCKRSIDQQNASKGHKGTAQRKLKTLTKP